MAETKIEWAEAVWNPVTGCTKISAGCKNCYAERMSKRLAGRCGYPKEEPFRVTLHPEKLHDPMKWKKPRRIFVNSMSDLFHPDVPDSFIRDIFWRIWFYSQHTFIVLTKRPERVAGKGQCTNCGYLAPVGEDEKCPNCGVTEKHMREAGFGDKTRDWPKNLWLGVSVENQAAADERIPLLLQTPAAVKFLSCEPLLGSIDLTKWLLSPGWEPTYNNPDNHDCERPAEPTNGNIQWVIAGGESGPGARPMHPDWVRSLRDQCQAAEVPFFFKSWGEWLPNAQKYNCDPGGNDFEQRHEMVGNVAMCRVGKKKSGRMLDGREWNEFPEVQK